MEKKDELSKILKSEGYYEIREIEGVGICGLYKYIFTTGLTIGLNEIGYYGRYCYSTEREALEALNSWDGKGDPEGLWLKYKGSGGERTNPLVENACKNCIKK
jgi:hypothetical protein